jgi:hypothetical protein
MLCLLAQHFPRSVGNLLQRGQSLKRRFREETITDLLMANLLALGGGSIIVDFPDEPTTGADMEWNFINRDTREYFQIILQAKRLSEVGADWRDHRYKDSTIDPDHSKFFRLRLYVIQRRAELVHSLCISSIIWRTHVAQLKR